MATADLRAFQPKSSQRLPGRLQITTAKLATIPSSLPPFWIICGLTLLIAHYQLWGRFNFAYKGLGILVVAMMIVTSGFTRMLSRMTVLWLLAFELVMVVNMALGRFYSVSDLFTSSSPPIVLLRCLPLLLCGYTLARFPRQERSFLLAVATIYWLFCLPDLVGFVGSARSGYDRSMQQVTTQGLDGMIDAKQWAKSYLSCFIYFAPLLIFFAITLCRIYPTVSNRTRSFVVAMQVTFLATALLSGFGASVLLCLVTAVMFGFFAPVRSFGYRAFWIAVSAAGLTLVDYLRNALFSSGNRSAVAQAFAKVTSLLTGLFDRSSGADLVERFQAGSSNRALLLWQSFESFLRSPLFGVGFQEDSTDVGGHSFLVDSAASFGLVGFIPIAAFFALIVFGLVRARRRSPTSWPIASSQMFMSTLIVGLVINPYLLEMLSLSYFLFLFLGLAIADSEALPASSETRLYRAASAGLT